MYPNYKLYNPDPVYIRGLIKQTGLTQKQAAEQCGVKLNSLTQYINPKHPSKIRYGEQYILEVIASNTKNNS